MADKLVPPWESIHSCLIWAQPDTHRWCHQTGHSRVPGWGFFSLKYYQTFYLNYVSTFKPTCSTKCLYFGRSSGKEPHKPSLAPFICGLFLFLTSFLNLGWAKTAFPLRSATVSDYFLVTYRVYVCFRVCAKERRVIPKGNLLCVFLCWCLICPSLVFFSLWILLNLNFCECCAQRRFFGGTFLSAYNNLCVVQREKKVNVWMRWA